MNTHRVTLTDEERATLVDLLESALKETLIEEHRTRKPRYREGVVHQGEVISQVLEKLKLAVS